MIRGKGGIQVKIRECADLKLAMILKQLPLISWQMGHVKAQGTIKDYVVSSDSNVELEFVCDIFNLQTKEIIDKWYGGHEGARGLITELRKLNDK